MQYQNKVDLITSINKILKKYVKSFETVKEEQRDILIESINYSPFQMLAITAGWIEQILEWENQEVSGCFNRTTKDFKWNDSSELFEKFYLKYKMKSLKELLDTVISSTEKLNQLILEIDEEDFFVEGKRKWANTTIKKNSASKIIRIKVIYNLNTFRIALTKWKEGN